ncbi:MAG TPA: envelope stress response membrane protein PspB [Woeseiaceae bacterium]|nr:envelope stress response membrane protein PspB [Woeseiaceae bacterium]
MYALMTLAVVLFLTVLAPLIVIFYFITKWKQTREISGDDERMLEELWTLSQRLEERIETLERILDDDSTTYRRQ